MLHYDNVTHAPMHRARPQPSEEFWANRSVAARQAAPVREEKDLNDYEPPPLPPPPPPPQAPAPLDEPDSPPPTPALVEQEPRSPHPTGDADKGDEGDEGEEGDEGDEGDEGNEVDDGAHLQPHLMPLVLPDEYNDLDEWDTSEEELHGFVRADEGSESPSPDPLPRRAVFGRPQSLMVRRYGWWVRVLNASPEY